MNDIQNIDDRVNVNRAKYESIEIHRNPCKLE